MAGNLKPNAQEWEKWSGNEENFLRFLNRGASCIMAPTSLGKALIWATIKKLSEYRNV